MASEMIWGLIIIIALVFFSLSRKNKNAGKTKRYYGEDYDPDSYHEAEENEED